MKNWILPLCLASLLCCSACGPEIIFEQQQTISSTGWAYPDVLHYDFDIADTNRLYNIFLELEHTTNFATQNLYVLINTGFPDGQKIPQKLSIDMADKIGRWLGDCSGATCTLDLPIQTNAYFNQIGKHSFTLEQYMRVNPLAEVTSINFRIEVSEKNK